MKSIQQFGRYVVVGLISNIAGYLVYLFVTLLGVEAKTAMTLLYLAGAAISFYGNRRWVFGKQGVLMSTLLRFILAHLSGYSLNFLLLVVFVDTLHYPHQLIQGMAILIVAVFLFATFRAFVFQQHPDLQKRAP